MKPPVPQPTQPPPAGVRATGCSRMLLRHEMYLYTALLAAVLLASAFLTSCGTPLTLSYSHESKDGVTSTVGATFTLPKKGGYAK